MFRKYVLPIAMNVGMLIAMTAFLYTSDIRFGFLATWFVLGFYNEIAPRSVNIILEAPKDVNKRQEEKTDEGDSHRD